MNNLQQTEEINKEYNNCFPDLLDRINIRKKATKLKQKIKENGCGEEEIRGAYTFKCGDISSKGNIQLCPSCKKAIEVLEEVEVGK